MPPSWHLSKTSAPRLIALGYIKAFHAFLSAGSAIPSQEQAVGGLITWLGVVAIRWATAAAWGVIEITLTSDMLRVRRARWQAEVTRADFRSTEVRDQFQLAHELLVAATGHRVVRILNGRGVAELKWLANLIDSQLANESESPVNDRSKG